MKITTTNPTNGTKHKPPVKYKGLLLKAIDPTYLFANIQRKEQSEWFCQAMSCLPKRYQQVLILRFGLCGEILTFGEIAPIMHITRECIRQLEHKALYKLVKHLKRLNNEAFEHAKICTIVNHVCKERNKKFSPWH